VSVFFAEKAASFTFIAPCTVVWRGLNAPVEVDGADGQLMTFPLPAFSQEGVLTNQARRRYQPECLYLLASSFTHGRFTYGRFTHG
jgi:hypothetical protein